MFYIHYVVYRRQQFEQFLSPKTVETDGVHFITVFSNNRVNYVQAKFHAERKRSRAYWQAIAGLPRALVYYFWIELASTDILCNATTKLSSNDDIIINNNKYYILVITINNNVSLLLLVSNQTYKQCNVNAVTITIACRCANERKH